MPTKIDLQGKRFGKLVALQDPSGQGHNPKIFCRCDCGNSRWITKHYVKQMGEEGHCGCQVEKRATYGASIYQNGKRAQLYDIWSKQKHGSGIDPRWNDFAQMLADVGDKDAHVVRLRRDQPLGPDNYLVMPDGFRGIPITVNGETRSQKGWADLLGFSRERARQLHRKGKLVPRVEAHLAKESQPKEKES